MKTIIAGSREIDDAELVEVAIADSGFVITEVVCGCAPGVDMLGSNWAARHNVPVKCFPAKWSEYGRRAGPIRNCEMAKYADALICVHRNTPGSLHMVREARRRGLKVYEMVNV